MKQLTLTILLLFIISLGACDSEQKPRATKPAPPTEQVVAEARQISEAAESPQNTLPEPVETADITIISEKTDAAIPEMGAVIETTISTNEEALLDLAQKSGCLACHTIEKKRVGPAWRDVSKRYKDDDAAVEKLIQKVKNGGRGNWTEITNDMMMPPYSPRVPDEQIALLVRLILGLEN